MNNQNLSAVRKPVRDIQTFSDMTGILGTVVFWILFILLMLIIPVMPKKPVYKTVQIHLASASAPKEIPQPVSAAPAEAPAKKSAPIEKAAPQAAKETTPAAKTATATKQAPAAKTAPAAAKSTAKKSAPAKTESAQTKTPAVQTLQKSVEELMAENNAPKKKEASWNESAFADSSGVSSSSSSSSSVQTPVKTVNALEGTAAAATSSASSLAAHASSSAANSSDAAQEAGSATKKALGNIASTSYTQHSGNGVSSSATANTGVDASGNVALQMDDGAARSLLDPKKPAIYLSDEAAKTIDGRKDVTIRFDVTASGNVPVTGIIITPASSFSPEVQKEIKDQISRWRFSQSSVPGKATIKCTVKPAD
jgi:hypothetical protein